MPNAKFNCIYSFKTCQSKISNEQLLPTYASDIAFGSKWMKKYKSLKRFGRFSKTVGCQTKQRAPCIADIQVNRRYKNMWQMPEGQFYSPYYATVSLFTTFYGNQNLKFRLGNICSVCPEVPENEKMYDHCKWCKICKMKCVFSSDKAA